MRPALPLAVAFLIGVAYALWVFGLSFLDPRAPFWRLPEGISGGLVDMRLILSGYFWFLQDSWHWPLLQIAQADPPLGANAGMMDVVPVLALIGKAVGAANPYPLWIIGCFGLNALSLAALLRALGQRSLVAAAAAGAMGAMMPLVHMRFGHSGLLAQFVFVLALAAAIAHGRADAAAGAGRNARVMAGLLTLCAVAIASSLYLYVMVAAIAAAVPIQAAIDRRMGVVPAGVALLGVLACGAVPVWAFGMLGGDADAVTVPFGYASMNLAAPFWPQTSGVFAHSGIYALTRGSIGATPGQYEGYCYLGAGLLLLLVICLTWPGPAASAVWRGMRRNPLLVLALAVLTLWAVSNQVYAGPVLLLSYPVPQIAERTVLAWFRASGRFFWPVAWLLAAASLTGVLRWMPPRPALILLVAAITIQWIDTSIWRGRLEALMTKTPFSAFGTPAASDAVAAEIARHGAARVIPALACSARPGDYSGLPTIGAVEMQLLAAQANAAMASVSTARSNVDCAAERATPIRTLAGTGLVLVLNQPPGRDRRDEARRDLDCREALPGLLCVAKGGTPP